MPKEGIYQFAVPASLLYGISLYHQIHDYIFYLIAQKLEKLLNAAKASWIAETTTDFV